MMLDKVLQKTLSTSIFPISYNPFSNAQSEPGVIIRSLNWCENEIWWEHSSFILKQVSKGLVEGLKW
jgi:predicted thioredoxin/glutaredoxin